MVKVSTSIAPFKGVTVSTPTELWAALFLRDLWQLDVAPNIPRCDPAPAFAMPGSLATEAEALTVSEVLELESVLTPLAPSAGLRGVFAAIELHSQVDGWRLWRDRSKREVQRLCQTLDSSPQWLCRDELAAHSPRITHVAIVPVAGDYSELRATTMYVALGIFREVESFRAALRANQ